MQRIATSLLQISYSTEKKDSIVYKIKEFTDPLFGILEKQLPENLIFVESISELVLTYLKSEPG